MGLLLCGKLAKQPFYYEKLDINLWSIQELSYVLYHYPVIIPEDFIDRKLLYWLREELSMDKLCERLSKGLEVHEEQESMIIKILEEANYYTEKEVSSFGKERRRLKEISRAHFTELLGDTFFRLGKYGKALEAYRESVAGSGNPQVEIKLADVYVTVMQFDKARSIYEGILKEAEEKKAEEIEEDNINKVRKKLYFLNKLYYLFDTETDTDSENDTDNEIETDNEMAGEPANKITGETTVDSVGGPVDEITGETTDENASEPADENIGETIVENVGKETTGENVGETADRNIGENIDGNAGESTDDNVNETADIITGAKDEINEITDEATDGIIDVIAVDKTKEMASEDPEKESEDKAGLIGAKALELDDDTETVEWDREFADALKASELSLRVTSIRDLYSGAPEDFRREAAELIKVWKKEYRDKV